MMIVTLIESHHIISVLLSLIFGGIIGSFANMLIYRLPLNKSIVFPGSFCPTCTASLSWKNLIPVISFVIQKGKCSSCSSLIGARYFIVELIYIGFTYIYLSPTSLLFLNHQFFIFSCICTVLFFTDLDHFILPFYLNCSLSILGLIMVFSNHNLILYVISTSIFSGTLIVFRLLLNYIYKKDTFGLGDIILLTGFSLNWGWLISFISLYFASIIGGTFCIYLLLTKQKKRLDYIAFGPFLMVGFYIAYFFNPLLLEFLF